MQPQTSQYNTEQRHYQALSLSLSLSHTYTNTHTHTHLFRVMHTHTHTCGPFKTIEMYKEETYRYVRINVPCRKDIM